VEGQHPSERLDPRNGLAVCPAHNVAFGSGMICVDGRLRIDLAPSLARPVETDELACSSRPPPREALLRPPGSQVPGREYLDWHRAKSFAQ